jgi:osmotically-inducible protein OsmY
MTPAAQLELPLIDRVQQALQQSPHVSRRDVQLAANAGRVVLSGVVGSFFQKQMAQEALRRIEGVESIENQLQVHWK